MTRRFLAACGVLACAAALVPAAATAAAPMPHYYLALGDSLSVGYQPDASGQGVETHHGYTNDLFAYERPHVPALKLVELGCPGDTTTSMLTGEGNSSNATQFHCDRAGGSQLKAAERFLRAHHNPGEVPLITIDIGANDVDGCADVPASQIGSCVSNGEASIERNLPIILAGIKKAAPKGTSFASMTLYDPALADYFSSNSTEHSLWAVSVSLVKGINADITQADTAGGFRTADVAGAFDTYDMSDTVAFDGQTVPLDVARLCSWTWGCTAPPRGPNIHANKQGYAEIAGAFEKVLGKLN